MGALVAMLLLRETDDQSRVHDVSRAELLNAFVDAEIPLRRYFGAGTGPVDAAYALDEDAPLDETPLIVELFRGVAAAKIRERQLLQPAPGAETEMTVLRTANVVVAILVDNADLVQRSRDALDALDRG